MPGPGDVIVAPTQEQGQQLQVPVIMAAAQPMSTQPLIPSTPASVEASPVVAPSLQPTTWREKFLGNPGTAARLVALFSRTNQ